MTSGSSDPEDESPSCECRYRSPVDDAAFRADSRVVRLGLSSLVSLALVLARLDLAGVAPFGRPIDFRGGILAM